MKKLSAILLVLVSVTMAACSPGASVASSMSDVAGLTPKYRNILLRDFRTVKDGVVVNYNIGTAAHCPGTLAVLRRMLPDDVGITVWADAPLCPELQEMMDRRWPDVHFVYGKLSSDTAGELRDAVDRSDLLLVSSGSSVASSVKASVDSYRALTGKSVAAYAVGSVPDDLAPLMDFCWIRDEKSLGKYAGIPSVCG